MEYYVVVDAEWAPCGHFHADYFEARTCPHHGNAGQILRIQAARPRDRTKVLDPTAPLMNQVGGGGRWGDSVHVTAVVAESARIAENVQIGAYAIVGDGVVVGRDSVLRDHCIVRNGTIVGKRTVIDSLAVVGGDPQDLSFDPAVGSGVVVGDQVTLREGVTVHRSTVPGGVTTIGDDAILMANCHVGHDGAVGQNAILANNVMLGGRVEVGAYAFLGGGTGVHQNVRIGEGAMIGGNASITYDIPPFTLVSGRNRIHGLNMVGLRRRQIPELEITDLKQCYRAVFSGPTDLRQTAAAALRSGGLGETGPGRRMLEFFTAGVRGFARPARRG